MLSFSLVVTRLVGVRSKDVRGAVGVYVLELKFHLGCFGGQVRAGRQEAWRKRFLDAGYGNG